MSEGMNNFFMGILCGKDKKILTISPLHIALEQILPLVLIIYVKFPVNRLGITEKYLDKRTRKICRIYVIKWRRSKRAEKEQYFMVPGCVDLKVVHCGYSWPGGNQWSRRTEMGESVQCHSTHAYRVSITFLAEQYSTYPSNVLFDLVDFITIVSNIVSVSQFRATIQQIISNKMNTLLLHWMLLHSNDDPAENRGIVRMILCKRV